MYLSKRPPHARIRGGSSTPHDATRTLQPRRQLPPSLQSRRERAGRGRAGRGGEIGAGACAGYSTHEGRGQGRRNRGELEARKAAEQRRGGRERATGGEGFSDRWWRGRWSLNASLSWDFAIPLNLQFYPPTPKIVNTCVDK